MSADRGAAGSDDLVVGIDGGGTGSRAVLCDRSGREIYREVGGAAIVRPGAEATSIEAIEDLVARTLDGAGVRGDLASLVAGLAGVGFEGARHDMERRLAGLKLARAVTVVSDVDVAFHDAFGDSHGILLIAGTGSVALGRVPSGRKVRSGGWGSLVGDEGSGWYFGIEGLKAAMRARDGRGPETVLAEVLPASMGYSDSAALVHHLWGVPKAEIAALAPRVIAAADDGDREAERIVDMGVEGLAAHLVPILREWGRGGAEPAVALLGGLVVPGGPLRARLRSRLQSLSISLREAPPDGARGAARLGLERL